MAAGFEWIIRSPTVLTHLPPENIWGTAVHRGILTRAVTIVVIVVIRSATLTVTVIATTVGMTGRGTETPMAVITVTGVTAAVRHHAVDVTHLITESAGAIREVPLEVAALARISMALPMVPLTPPIMLKMAAGGKASTVSFERAMFYLFFGEGKRSSPYR
jgi:hypothetical protein